MAKMSIRGISLNVKIMGKGYPLVLMHGGPGADLYTMMGFKPLADQFSLIFYDHRCNGRSTGVDVTTMTFENLTADADALRQTLIINLLLDLPASLGADRQSRSSETVACPVTVCATLWNHGKRLEIETTVDNRAEDHRLRVHFPLGGADAGYTAGHYQVHGRLPTNPLPYMDGWVEQPRPELPQRTFSTLMDEDGNMTITAPGLYEVELMRTDAGGELVLTLLRCVGWLSRPDLSTRSGGAGPSLPTPGSQEQGMQRFHYAVIPHPGDWHSAAGQVEGFDLPLRAVNAGLHAGSLPAKCSLVQTSGLILTAVKASEDGHGLAVRGWAPAAGPVRIHPWKRFSYGCQARIDETPLDDVQVEPDGTVTVDARENEVVTVVVSG